MNSLGSINSLPKDQNGVSKKPLTTPMNFDLTNPPKTLL